MAEYGFISRYLGDDLILLKYGFTSHYLFGGRLDRLNYGFINRYLGNCLTWLKYGFNSRYVGVGIRGVGAARHGRNMVLPVVSWRRLDMVEIWFYQALSGGRLDMAEYGFTGRYT